MKEVEKGSAKKPETGGELLSGETLELLRSAVAALHDVSNRIGKDLNEAIESVSKRMMPSLNEIARNLSGLPEDFAVIQEALAERGWFVMAGMPAGEYRSLRGLVDAGDFDELDQQMGAWTYHLLDETEEHLCKQFPKREALLREGFENHRSGRYASAITLLLTQADGLCFDSIDKIYFKERQEPGGVRVTGVKSDLSDLGLDGMPEIIMFPMRFISGINANEQQIRDGEFPNSPHRSPILHGKITDYNTELNSLKIISLVGFVGGIAHRIITELKEARAAERGAVAEESAVVT